MKRLIPGLILLVLILTSCASNQEGAVTTVEDVYYIYVTPALRPFWPALQACTAEQPESTIVIRERFYDPANLSGLVIHLGEPPELPSFAIPLAGEQIVAVVNLQNQITSLSLQQVQDIFHSTIQSWADVGGQGEINVWSLLDGDETRDYFDQQVLYPLRLTPKARLAPNAGLLGQAVSEDTAAIGYLPRAWVSEQLKTIDLGITLPVLALADSEPTGPMRDFLVCLQGEAGQSALPNGYSPLSVK
jgi:hypothetical protein